MRQALKERQGEALQAKLETACVAVCGLGGLGSGIAVMLARAGVGRLILIDFDTVDVTNLHRQQYKANQVGLYKTEALAHNLKEIAPYLTIETHTEKITPDNAVALLQGAEVICEALDQAQQKAMLANAVLEKLPGAYFVAASGMAGLGPANHIRTRRISDHFYLCGDTVSDVDSGMGLVAPRVMLCAAHQALAALRILARPLNITNIMED